jgi:hypothetical protein
MNPNAVKLLSTSFGSGAKLKWVYIDSGTRVVNKRLWGAPCPSKNEVVSGSHA